MKKKSLIIVLLLISFFIFLSYFSNKEEIVDLSNISIITVDNPETREKGLSGRESLEENQAMLFTFDYADKYQFWMKDMKFPIDIIWLDENSRIVHIEENVSPDTYPKTSFPPQESLYVLEANAGFSDKNHLEVGKIINFSKF